MGRDCNIKLQVVAAELVDTISRIER